MRMIDRRLELDLAVARKPAPSLVVRIYNTAATILRAWRNRSVTLRLSEFDDHQLLDIGLRREDVREAMASSFFADPGLHLTIAARERARRHLRSGRID
ncbi:MAG: DUF1127 domain-containing protein [Shinella sp.]|nr:DUF1127 domain-containing protein [Shinella sp.]